MNGAQVLVEAASLIEEREPFVIVTVLWRRGPSSGQAGAKALVLVDGTMRGWIGGACAAPTVLAQAQQCLATGTPARLLLGQGDEVDERASAAATVVPMACESDGALEVYMEPILPPLRVVVIGRSPAVDALASMAQALGWDAVVIDDGGSAHEHLVPAIVRTKMDLSDIVVDRATAIVVATQGHYDDLALTAALDTPAGYIGLVASRPRAASVLDQLRSDGLTDDALDRIHAPAGLDLGNVEHAEMAAAILADLVRRRAEREFGNHAYRAPAASAIDPICGMTVNIGDAKYHALHEGVDYWFCASGCKRAFEADPTGALDAG